MKIERTKNTTRNTFWGIIYRVLSLLLPFISRTVLLKILGDQYLGLNSLFSSVLQVLNMTDLGIGSAIVYSMYKPIAEDDNDAICALLNLYKKLFHLIGTVILVLGIALLPFLKYLINGTVPDGVNIQLIFIIYLFNSVISYFLFAYKKAIINAYQRNDIETKISLVLLFLQYGLQIGLLLAINNYYVYLLVLPVITIASNIATSIVTNKLFPDLTCKGSVPTETKNSIKKQVRGLCIGKICGTTRNSLDSIFISSFLGLTEVAIYSNYYFILNGIHSLLTVITTSMMGGVGNSLVSETKEKTYRDFRKFTFLYSWISGWCACCMLCLYQHFMRIWVGDSLLFPVPVMILFCLYLYSMSTIDMKTVYESAAGLWWENRQRAVFEFIVNLVLNYALGRYFGVVGILLATLVTIIVINFIYGSYILFKYLFVSESLIKFYLRHVFYYIVVIGVSAVTYYLCSLLPTVGFTWLIVKAFVCLIAPNCLFFIVYHKSDEYKDSKPLINRFVRRIPAISIFLNKKA